MEKTIRPYANSHIATDKSIQKINYNYSKKTYDAELTNALMHFAVNVGPGHSVHLCSLIWAFSVHLHLLQFPLILYADDGPDQPAHSALIWAYVICKLQGPCSCIVHHML